MFQIFQLNQISNQNQRNVLLDKKNLNLLIQHSVILVFRFMRQELLELMRGIMLEMV